MFLTTKEATQTAELKAFYDEALVAVGLDHRYITRTDWKFVIGHEIIRKVRSEKQFLGLRWNIENEVIVGHFAVEPVPPSFTLLPVEKKPSAKLHVIVVDETAVHPIRTFCRKFEERFGIRAFLEIHIA